MMVERSIKLAQNHCINFDMVYVVASFHDISCFMTRNNHEEIPGHFIE